MPSKSKSKSKPNQIAEKQNSGGRVAVFDILENVQKVCTTWYNILHRVAVFDILENVQKVCTTWHKICKDPAMWRVICLDKFFGYISPHEMVRLWEICKHAVDRSQCQLVSITIVDIIAADRLLEYVADRSSQLRCLEIRYGYGNTYGSWTEVLKNFPLLEELGLYLTKIPKEAKCWPLLPVANNTEIE
ncbi:hypothetical protein L2E82_50358 [Cichorium intybus]|nr:hypothetical protein L2E82_50358 [Cichorium intybus]